jgi:next to BRCA1 gene 1 protein
MMATPAMPTTPPTASGVNGDTLVIIKVLYAGQNRRFKLALRDLGAQSLPQKVSVTINASA